MSEEHRHTVGKCPEHGPTADVDVRFPEGGQCNECGRELERIKIVESERLTEAMEA